MKKYTLLLFACVGMHAMAQETVDASGGDAQSPSGSVAYSVGQVTTNFNTGTGSLNEGVQQPYEFFEVAGIEELADINLSVFPNPTSGLIHLKSDVGISGTVSIYDAQGKRVFNEAVNTPEKTVDLRALSTGMYNVTIQTPKGQQTLKVIKH